MIGARPSCRPLWWAVVHLDYFALEAVLLVAGRLSLGGGGGIDFAELQRTSVENNPRP